MDPAPKEELTLSHLLNAPEDQLRAVVHLMCLDSEVLRKALKHYSAVQSVRASNQLKRKASCELSVCVLCEAPFTEADNVDGSCVYHPEIDDDHETWADTDWYHGDQDTEENRIDFPEAFNWDCCNQNATGKGCVSGRHKTEASHGNARSVDRSHVEYVVIDDDDDGDDDNGEQSEDEE